MMKHQKKITAFVASSLPRLISSVFLICGLLSIAVSVFLFIGPFAPIPQQSPAQIQHSEPVAEIVASPTPELQPEIAIHSSVPSLPPVQITPVLDSPAPAQAPQPTKNLLPIRVPILLYHYVRDTVHSRDIVRYEMNVKPAVFEEQLTALIGDGYHFVTMAQVSAALDGSSILPEKPIVLTFDDGLVDVHTTVFPLLKKYQVPITLYLVPAFLDHRPYLTSDMVKELAHSGLVEIGSHTTHHLKLKTLSDEKTRSEIIGSKASLEKLLGVSVDTFAYPFGLYGESHPALVKEAGYTSAVTIIWTVVGKSTDKYLLPRLNVGERIGKELVAFLKGFK